MPSKKRVVKIKIPLDKGMLKSALKDYACAPEEAKHGYSYDTSDSPLPLIDDWFERVIRESKFANEAEKFAREYMKKIKENSEEFLKSPSRRKEPPATNDNINSPSHYRRGSIEVWDFILDQGLDYFLGNVVKYVCRAGHKGDKMEDLLKAQAYIVKAIEACQGGDAA